MTSNFRRPHGKWLAPIAGVIVIVAGSSVALANTLTTGAVVRVPDNPLGGNPTCAALVAQQTALGSTNFPDAEVEPQVAVDPTNPMHLIGSVQQDRWNDGGANGLTDVVSTDGGASWHLAAGQPQFTICAGAQPGSPGFFDRATDPWVGFSDDGNHWQTPVTARLDPSMAVLNDKESVTGDPLIANNAYAVWDRLESPQVNANPSATVFAAAFRGPTLFSRTTDKGVTWSQGRIIFDPGQNDQTIGNQIVVPTTGPAKGVLIDGMSLITNRGANARSRHRESAARALRSPPR